MALSCIMKNLLKQSSIKPAIAVAARFTPISSLSINRHYSMQHHVTPLKDSLLSVQNIRQISTSPVRMSAHGDHSKVWTLERILSLALIGLMPMGFVYPSIPMDVMMAVSVVMHTHWGIEAIAVDYIRPIIFGPVIPKIALLFVYLISIATLVGLLNLIFNGPGLANSVQQIWKL